VILDGRVAQGIEGLQRGGMDLRGLVVEIAGDRDRAVIAVPWPVAVFRVGLETTEGRQDVLETPARVAVRSPGIEVGRRAAHGEPGEPGRAPEQLATAQCPRRAHRVRLGLQPPVRYRRQAPAIAKFDGRRTPEIRSRLEHQDRSIAGLRQAACDHAAGRASTDNHDIEPVARSHVTPPPAR
jgi:hypothetical protein